MTKRVRVVVADDHVATRAGIRAALAAGGFDVVAEAADGPAAVRAAVRHRPDVCLVDVHMPGSGIAAAAEIAAKVPEAAIVMLTAAPEEDHLFAALKAGATGYLLKDIPGSRLGDALLAVVRGEAALPRALVPRLIDEFRRLDHSGRRRALPRRSTLTTREWEVLECMREGLSNRQIAERLYLSEVTVRRHAGSILKKLHVKSRGEAVDLANSVQEI